MDVFKVSEIIVNHIKANYSQDVAIVGYYGSYLQGRATKRSDLDFFFIPATPRGRSVELQFIIDGISFDFYPIGWERAERMAAFDNWNTTIIADCELLYVRSDEDHKRFINLRETIHAMKDQSNSIAFTNKAEHVLRDCVVTLEKFHIDGSSLDLSYCRTLAQEVAGQVFKCLGYLNQTYFTRSWGHYREQVRDLPLKPERLDTCLDTIMLSKSTDDIQSACKQLIHETLSLITTQRNSQPSIQSYEHRMKGFYEEERGMLNKLLTACEKGHYETAFFVAIGVQDDIARILYAAEKGHWPGEFDVGEYRQFYSKFGFPELVNLLDPENFDPLRLAVLQLIDKFEEHIVTRGVKLNKFNTIEEFEAFYRNGCEA